MIMPSDSPVPPSDSPRPRRLFLHEPGWRIGLKIGTEREFCFMITPGQDYYHRIHDHEVYLYNHEERLCIPCAERRGLLTYEPRGLREPLGEIKRGAEELPTEFRLAAPEGNHATG